MAAKKITVSLDATTHSMAEQAARRDGLTMSAWLARAARREAVRLGVGPARDSAVTAVEGDAATDEAELIAAEEDMRAAG